MRISDLGKYGYEKVETDGKTFIICGTPMSYDDLFSEFADKALERFGYDTDECMNNGTTPILRDKFIETFEKEMRVKFLSVFDEY